MTLTSIQPLVPRCLTAILLLGSLLVAPVQAQETQRHIYRALVKSVQSEEVLVGVNVSIDGTMIGAATNSEGLVAVIDIPSGRQTIIFSFVGFETIRRTYTFPLDDSGEIHLVLLEEAHSELEEVSVSATRTSRTIADQATRVETIAGEEIDEKISMEPSNISMLLNESPGITVQQTSAVSGGASLRIQGLDGRYTQILKDGFPLFGGFSGGLSLLQVPPLDLQQVEIIKGPSSTLYGGDAIAGLVNLVSKKPTEESEVSLLANVTTAGGYDLGGFYTARNEHFGITFLASGNLQDPYDPDDDDFSNLPDIRRLTLSPKVFYYPNAATVLSFGVSGTFEDRKGGDLEVLERGPTEGQTFIERNKSTRLTSQLRLDHGLSEVARDLLGGESSITLKNSVSLFERAIQVPDSRFEGRQVATYSEASLHVVRESHDLVVGFDLRTDAFREDAFRLATRRNYTYSSAGVFAQDTWDVSDRVVVEAGIRAEYHNTYDLFVLPKASLLYRMTDRLSARVGAGLGYKAPTVFLEPSEERAFRDVLPLGTGVEAETSRGGSFDVNYRVLLFDRVALSLNQAFYFTTLEHPLVPVMDQDVLLYESADGSIRTRALETNAKLSLGDFKLFLGYVYLNARSYFADETNPLSLTPEHTTYTVFVYEKHGLGRIGLEAYYTGPQELANGKRTDGYWITGIMAERRFGSARLFLNFENFLDTKQSNYAPVVLGPRSSPRFAEIWAPMDGFIVNGGIKFTL